MGSRRNLFPLKNDWLDSVNGASRTYVLQLQNPKQFQRKEYVFEITEVFKQIPTQVKLMNVQIYRQHQRKLIYWTMELGHYSLQLMSKTEKYIPSACSSFNASTRTRAR